MFSKSAEAEMWFPVTKGSLLQRPRIGDLRVDRIEGNPVSFKVFTTYVKDGRLRTVVAEVGDPEQLENFLATALEKDYQAASAG